MSETALLWLRRDLRLHDSPALMAAHEADRLLPVYVFDPRQYGEVEFGGADSFRYRKTGARRARFRLEALASLRERLQDRGSELVVRRGRPEEALSELAAAVDADAVYHHTYPTAEEVDAENAVAEALRADGLAVHSFWGHTLYHPEDLPMPVTEVPDVFTDFREAVEADAEPGQRLRPPPLPAPPAVEEVGEIGEVSDLPGDLEPPEYDDRSVHRFFGGERAGKQRIDEWMWEGDNLREYKETRNGLLGADYSSKFSPWLSEGCLSPRYLAAEIDHYEDQKVENESTYWLRFELLWRDFFQFQFAKHRRAFWSRGGIREREDIDWRADPAALDRWKRGQTGVPFVDANMRELEITGYMSNRGRQNVASFLANDLRIDWRRGAAHFETELVDYDPCSNYGNWAYVAGVGNDPRDRQFDVLAQAHEYDPDAEYVATWLPQLSELPPEYAHEPWRLDADQQAEYGLELGVDYPEPVIEPERIGP